MSLFSLYKVSRNYQESRVFAGFWFGELKLIGLSESSVPLSKCRPSLRAFLGAESRREQLQLGFMANSRGWRPPNRLGFWRPDWQRGFFPIASPLRNCYLPAWCRLAGWHHL